MPRTPRLKVSPLWTFRCKTPRPNLRTSLCLLRPPGGFLTLLCDENRYYPAYPKGRCGAASSRSSGSIMRRSWACRSSPGTQAFIAIGSNLGDRAANMRKALSALKDVAEVERVSGFYETRAQYVSDQPDFLNAVCRVKTRLEPRPLLAALKDIEQRLGRKVGGVRFGPRVIDLDILFYGDRRVDLPADPDNGVGDLSIPHPRFSERDFVLYPLADVDPPPVLPSGDSLSGLLTKLEASRPKGQPYPTRVLAAPSSGRVLPVDRRERTVVMGILNVTPDSFSDGGRFNERVEVAVKHAMDMASLGAAVVDVGGESTRPGAKAVVEEEEVERVVPVIEGIRKASDRLWVSVDTRRAKVAEAAVRAGADMVNDVSGGGHDRDMLATVARLGVPYVMMHMRGDPTTMTSLAKYGHDVVGEVAQELSTQVEAAERAGVCGWDLVVDPGIGFAKDMEHNLALLQGLDRFSALTRRLPLLVGTSRKRFLGTICKKQQAEERDVATSAAHALAIEKGAAIVRVHNVGMAVDTAAVVDAIRLWKMEK